MINFTIEVDFDSPVTLPQWQQRQYTVVCEMVRCFVQVQKVLFSNQCQQKSVG